MTVQTTQTVDAKGRPTIESMTDREVFEEVLLRLRSVEDMMEQVKVPPMLSGMFGGLFQ